MNNLFANLKPFQKIEFILMTMLAIAIPFHWYAAQIFEVALTTCALTKVVFWQKFHFNDTQMRWKWAYFIFMATWLIYLIGMIYTQNADYGWTQVCKKFGFLFFPMIFLFSDMSYLTKNHVRIIFYGLVGSCFIYFLMNIFSVTIDIITNSKYFDFQCFGGDNLQRIYYVHHTYMTMYATLAIAFLSTEIFSENKKSVKIIDLVIAVFLMIFLILLDSRAGILCFGILLIIIVLWIFITLKKKKIALIITVALLFFGGLTMIVSPNIFSRITNTFENVKSERTDRRIIQMRGYMPLIEENWIFGVGTGDRVVETNNSYRRYREYLVNQVVPCDNVDNETFTINRNQFLNDILEITQCPNNWNEPNPKMDQLIENKSEKYHCDKESVKKIAVEYIYINDAIELNINAHNQYFETIIAVGIFGLLLMIAYFVIPIFVMVKQKTFDLVYVVFIVIIAFNALFESIFEGQVGIIFFNFFNVLLFSNLITNDTTKIADEK